MLKTTTIKLLLSITLVLSSFCTMSATQLAGWDFHLWTGTGSAHNSTLDALVADMGTQVSTAILTPSKIWANPSTGGYVRFDNTPVDASATISGISTVGLSQVYVTWAVGSNAANVYTVVMEYSINGGTIWTQVGTSLPLTIVSGATSNFASDGFTSRQLPSDALGVAALQVRVRVSAATAATSRLLFDNISIDDTNAPSGINPNNTSLVKVVGSKGEINILGAQGLAATVYNLIGSKLTTVESLSIHQTLLLPANAMYIVKIGEKTYKVKL